MDFQEILDEYRRQFPSEISILKKDQKNFEKPRGGGVYLIYGENDKKRELLYIGKTGGLDVQREGFEQRLRKGQSVVYNAGKRLSRPSWFQYLMEKCGYGKLTFEFIITWPIVESNGSIIQNPVIVETKLLSAWKSGHGGRKPPGHGSCPCEGK